ncbi:MAG: DUF1786 domain-containing protein, partial [Nitrososphaerales archaeon]|nr:DUF1786 domain-containing protein [Nitrososphaerales archaeon]
MVSVCCIDVGLGTQDILFFDQSYDYLPKMILPSATQIFARKIAKLTHRNLLITGGIIGGGPITRSVKELISKGGRVKATLPAALTFSYNLDHVKSMGIEIIDRISEFEKDFTIVELKEIDLKFLLELARRYEICDRLDYIVFAVQDHGKAPEGVSAIEYRHNLLKSFIEENPKPISLFFEDRDIPDTLLRMKSVSQQLRSSISGEPFSGKIYATDTVIAACVGASLDPNAIGKKRIVTIDIGNGHTFASMLVDGEIVGYFETHTSTLTPEMLERFVQLFIEGRLTHEQILREGGHGAYTSEKCRGPIDAIIVTGPK